MGEDIVLSGKLIREENVWAVELMDGQRLRLVSSSSFSPGADLALVVTTQARYQKTQQELAHHLLAEILNGS